MPGALRMLIFFEHDSEGTGTTQNVQPEYRRRE